MTGVVVTVLVVAVAALLVIVGAQQRAMRAERYTAGEATAEARATRRLWRREVQELTTELAVARAELHALRRLTVAEPATPTPDDLPALDSTTLRQVWACSPADFDAPGDAR